MWHSFTFWTCIWLTFVLVNLFNDDAFPVQPRGYVDCSLASCRISYSISCGHEVSRLHICVMSCHVIRNVLSCFISLQFVIFYNYIISWFFSSSCVTDKIMSTYGLARHHFQAYAVCDGSWPLPFMLVNDLCLNVSSLTLLFMTVHDLVLAHDLRLSWLFIFI